MDKLEEINLNPKIWDISANDGTNDLPLQANIRGAMLCMSARRKFKPRRVGLEMIECDAETNKNLFVFVNDEIKITNKWGKVKCMSFDENEVTVENCGEDSGKFFYNQFTGQLEVEIDDETKCIDVDTRASHNKVIIGECESETHVASSFGMPSSSDNLFQEIDGLLANAAFTINHEWILFSNEFQENVLYANKNSEQLCTSVVKVFTGGSKVVSSFKGLKAVDCENYDPTDFSFYGDHGKLVMQSKWGNDFCITAWLTDDEILPSYIDVEECRSDVVETARSRTSGEFTASWSQSFEYDQSSGYIQVLSDDSGFDVKCVSLSGRGQLILDDCKNAVSFGKRLDAEMK